MLRSAIYRINLAKGRQCIKPVELECQSFGVDQPFIEVLKNVLENAINSCTLLSNEIVPHGSTLAVLTRQNSIQIQTLSFTWTMKLSREIFLIY